MDNVLNSFAKALILVLSATRISPSTKPKSMPKSIVYWKNSMINKGFSSLKLFSVVFPGLLLFRI